MALTFKIQRGTMSPRVPPPPPTPLRLRPRSIYECKVYNTNNYTCDKYLKTFT